MIPLDHFMQHIEMYSHIQYRRGNELPFVF